MSWMDKERFLEEFVYEVEKNFDVDDTPSSWADTEQSPAHRYWGDQDHRIGLPHSDNPTCRIGTSALTPDKKFIAASDGLVVNLYDIATKECRMLFKGLTQPVRSLDFSPLLTDTVGYTLMISSSESDRFDSDKHLLFLQLGLDGRRMVQPQLLDIDKILDLSMGPVKSKLDGLCGCVVASSMLDNTRAQYNKALNRLQATLEAKDMLQLDSVTGSCTSSISSDGKLLLYVRADNPFQGDPPRPRRSLRAIIYDLTQGREKHILDAQGDAINCIGFSPDDRCIATVANIGTLRIFDTESGKCKHTISAPRGQQYKSIWSPDSRHILLHGMARQTNEQRQTVSQIAYMVIYSAETGEQIAEYKTEELARRSEAIMTAWSPRDEIAIASGTRIWIWRLFENTTSTSLLVRIENPLMRLYAHFVELMWVEDGRMLIAKLSSGTIEVWDQDRNVKWRIERPRGPALARSAKGCYWLKESRTLVSFDSDASLRFYNF
ncbi:WD40 repeat-like protein [Aureobasidium sp. EXF-8845]|nr:WD40 repeat-like protein [Aureobasidium sp. EXF-8845]KAI4854880.1 WD40 repeat-like protein [Aureobasidium sp. EXF-8846]